MTAVARPEAVAWSSLGPFVFGVDAQRVRRIVDSREEAGEEALDLVEALRLPVTAASSDRRWLDIGARGGSLMVRVGRRVSVEPCASDACQALPAIVAGLGKSAGLAAVVRRQEGYGWLLDPDAIAVLGPRSEKQ